MDLFFLKKHIRDVGCPKQWSSRTTQNKANNFMIHPQRKQSFNMVKGVKIKLPKSTMGYISHVQTNIYT